MTPPLLFDQKWVRGVEDRVLWGEEATVRKPRLIGLKSEGGGKKSVGDA